MYTRHNLHFIYRFRQQKSDMYIVYILYAIILCYLVCKRKCQKCKQPIKDIIISFNEYNYANSKTSLLFPWQLQNQDSRLLDTLCFLYREYPSSICILFGTQVKIQHIQDKIISAGRQNYAHRVYYLNEKPRSFNSHVLDTLCFLIMFD